MIAQIEREKVPQHVLTWQNFSVQQVLEDNEGFRKNLPVNIHYNQFSTRNLLRLMEQLRQLDTVSLDGFCIGQLFWKGAYHSLDLQYRFSIGERVFTGPVIFAFFNVLSEDIFSKADKKKVRIHYSSQLARRFQKIADGAIAVPLAPHNTDSINSRQMRVLDDQLIASVEQDIGHQLLVESLEAATFLQFPEEKYSIRL